jgi:hypothetical protein
MPTTPQNVEFSGNLKRFSQGRLSDASQARGLFADAPSL